MSSIFRDSRDLTSWIYDKGIRPEHGSYIREERPTGKYYTRAIPRIHVHIVRDHVGNWYVEKPLYMGVFKDDKSEVPLRLLFQVDLWLFEHGYKLENIFVFPKGVN